METSVRKFKDVFHKINFTRSVAENLSAAEVRGIRLNKVTGKMRVELLLNKIINEGCLIDFEAQMKEKFPQIKEMDVSFKYSFGESHSESIIERYWDNILEAVKAKSPASHKILQNAKLNISNGKLLLSVTNNEFTFITHKGIDRFIQNILADRLCSNLMLGFESREVAGNDYEKKLLKRQLEMTSSISYTAIPGGKPAEKKKKTDFKDFRNKPKKIGKKGIKLLEDVFGKAIAMSHQLEPEEEIVLEGKILSYELRETKTGKYLVQFDITDRTDSITVKFFTEPENYGDDFKTLLKKGNIIKVKGRVQYDQYSKELNVMAYEIGPTDIKETRMDNAPVKRVELHLHSQMSSMDGVAPVGVYVNQAKKWGHKAVAITDHGVVQAFPEAMDASKGSGVKVIYGVEAYLVDDLGAVVQCPKEQTLRDTFVVFDLETTGLSKESDRIIEIGAVKVENLQITERFATMVNPQIPLTQKIVELTGIDDQMLKDAPLIGQVLPEFMEFVGDSVLVAHNAGFDMGFVASALSRQSQEINNTVLDTVELSRTLFPELSRHKLNIVAEHLGISLENHHRAVDDAEATAGILIKCAELLEEAQVHTLREINMLAGAKINKSKLKHYHAVILVKNYKGLRNLYQLVSKAHIDYFYKRPRIPKSEYVKFKEGLIIGTACEAGEFFTAILDKKPKDYIRQLAEFYDYFEIQPTGNNMYLVRNGRVDSERDLNNINSQIVELGEKYNKPVVATCDVHFLNPEDEVYRRIIMAGDGFSDANLQAPLYYRTTEEMLKEFSYLGQETAYRVVVENTNLIADMCDEIKPIPDKTFPPKIEGAEEQLRDITMTKAKEIFGQELPQIVSERLDKELNSIIKNGFSVMYIIAQKLVSRSMEDGYLVGSRGSVGSSLVATMSGITEVNPLPPHYICPQCKFSDFDSPEVKAFGGASGCDMPDRDCPVCGVELIKDGHDIPFETFLGFDGDKEPDIDLNFSGEYQARAHAYTEELFGSENVFKAGTIGTLADKTAYGYVKKYCDENELSYRNAEINRLVIGLTGIKRTTGQHPGGLMVVPDDHSIYEFCPIQRPANDMKSNVVTTHFDYHSISGRLLKLDLLGHDVPTIIRMLHDATGIDPRTVDLGDKKVISLFTSPDALGVSSQDINCKTGTLGLPEFGTTFVRNMLLDTMPSTFAELVRISGLSHGTDVWFNNAQDLIRDGKATLKEVIPTRDDIMVYLIGKGVEKKAAFKIMENVRKGKGLKEDEVNIMEAAQVPDWYIESCRRIRYMFPKGHAVAYVMMTVRIGYFKIHHPYAFYAASFSVKAEDFDYELMCHGKEIVREEIKRINALGKEAGTKEKNTLTILELVYEMYARGLTFVPLDLMTSKASKFTVTPNGLMPPLCSIQGLGASVAQNIVEARQEGEFYTIEDFRKRTKTNKTVIELLKSNGILRGLPENDQLTLEGFM